MKTLMVVLLVALASVFTVTEPAAGVRWAERQVNTIGELAYYLIYDEPAVPFPARKSSKQTAVAIKPRGEQAAPAGQVLAARTPAPVPIQTALLSAPASEPLQPNIASLVEETFLRYLSSGLLKGEKGDKGDIGEPGMQGAPGSAGASYAPISYVQPNYERRFNGASILAASDLSSQRFTTNTATVTDTLTAQNLNVSGTITGNVSGTINPGLTAGSVVFQGASGLAQDNSNFFWDDTNNRLGIGTNAPQTSLDIQGTTSGIFLGRSASEKFVFIQTAASSGYTANSFVIWNGITSAYQGLIMQFTDASSLIFNRDIPNAYTEIRGNNATETALTITQIGAGDVLSAGSLTVKKSGNVGIGTTSPGSKLDVNGTGNFAGTVSFGAAGQISTSGNGTTLQSYNPLTLRTTETTVSQHAIVLNNLGMDFQTGGTAITGGGYQSRMFITPQGNVGIGTTSPGTKLEVNGGITVANGSGNGFRTLANSGTTSYSLLYGDTVNDLILSNGMGGNTQIKTPSGGYIGFHTNGTEKIRLSNAGGLSIGSTYVSSDAGANNLIVQGNVGIGTTSPGTKLDVAGSVAASDTTVQTMLRLQRAENAGISYANMVDIAVGKYEVNGSNSRTRLDFILNDGQTNTAGVNVMTLTGAGNVGVGTTGPSYKLHVSRSDAGDVAGFTDSDGTCTINPTSTALSCSSDARLKKDVASIDNALDKVLGFKGVSFRWNSQMDNARRIGFIAQDVESVVPELVTTNEAGFKSVNYTSFAPLLVNAVQELSAKVDSLLDFSWVIEGFKKFGVVIEQEIIKIKSLAVEKLEIGSSDKPSGFVIYDKATSEPYCVAVENGQVTTTLGECEDDSLSSTSANSGPAPAEQVSSEQPAIDPLLEPSEAQETAPTSEVIPAEMVDAGVPAE